MADLQITAQTLDRHIETTPGVCSGKPRIAGRRITVQQIAVWHERLGWSADEIAEEYDLSLSEIHAALAYYFDHRDEMDLRIAEGQDFADELKQRSPSKVLQKLQEPRGHGDAG